MVTLQLDLAIGALADDLSTKTQGPQGCVWSSGAARRAFIRMKSSKLGEPGGMAAACRGSEFTCQKPRMASFCLSSRPSNLRTIDFTKPRKATERKASCRKLQPNGAIARPFHKHLEVLSLLRL